MARYSDLVNAVLRETPEAPHALIESEARAAVMDFCRRSRYWTETEVLLLEPGIGEYRLRPIDNGRIDQILRAQFASANGGYRTLDKSDRRLFMGLNDAGDPTTYAESADRIYLHPIYPNPAGVVNLHVVLVPLQSSMSFPDHIEERWREALVAGASARLLMHSNKPWTNENKAMLLQQKFDLAVRDARQNAASDQWAPQSIQLRRWV